MLSGLLTSWAHGPGPLSQKSGGPQACRRAHYSLTAHTRHKRLLCHLNAETPGESANAVPHYHKLRSRVSRIWGNRRGQHTRSAMGEPRPGKTTFLIMVFPLPGKYERLSPRPPRGRRSLALYTHAHFAPRPSRPPPPPSAAPPFPCLSAPHRHRF